MKGRHFLIALLTFVLLATALVFGCVYGDGRNQNSESDDTTSDDSSDDTTDDTGDDTSDDTGDDTGDDTADDTGDDTAVGLDDNFDSDTVGSPPPAPWSVSTTGAGTVLIYESKAGSGRWVEFTEAGTGDAAGLQYASDQPFTGVVTWQFDAAFSAGTYDFWSLISSQSDCSDAKQLVWWENYGGGGPLYAMNDAVIEQCQILYPETWYTIKVVADFSDAQTFSVFVDDVATTCASYPVPVSSFSCFHVGPADDSPADIGFDNVHLHETASR